LEGPLLQLEDFTTPINIKNVNIRTRENPKIANIGDYWDSETMEKIIELLCKYSDLLRNTILEMKGVAGEQGEMKIPLRLDAILVRKRPLIDRILESRIIEPVEESESISPMVVQEKKTGGIRICADLRKLNDAWLHDPFPTTFTDEV
jgi:hypothetical protein